MTSFRDIIEAWPDRPAFASDLEIDVAKVNVWHHRDSIPATHWLATARAAERRRIAGVTLEVMAGIAAARGGKQEAGTAPASSAARGGEQEAA